MIHRLKGLTTYLSGPIDYAPELGRVWRDELTPFLQNMDIKVLNPLKHNFHGTAEFNTVKRPLIKKLQSERNFSALHNEMQDIIRWDLHSVDISSFVIVNYDTTVHMCGTYHEMVVALQENKPVLLVLTESMDKLPMWIYGIANPEYMFKSFDKLKEFLVKLDSAPNYFLTDLDKKKWLFFDGDHMNA